jgi:uncharacterized surface protein with fasciclin (FAS1) repeats
VRTNTPEDPSSLSSTALIQAGAVLLVSAVFLVAGAACTQDESVRPQGADTAAVTPSVDSMSLRAVLRTDRRFSTLSAGLDSTGLDSALAGTGPYTLFAPPDTAFAALPDGTMPLLLEEKRARLRAVLSHHVVSERVTRAALTDSTVLTTLSGDSLRVRVTDSTVTVGTAVVVDGDVAGSNGLIHVIDRVLRPPSTDS